MSRPPSEWNKEKALKPLNMYYCVGCGNEVFSKNTKICHECKSRGFSPIAKSIELRKKIVNKEPIRLPYSGTPKRFVVPSYMRRYPLTSKKAGKKHIVKSYIQKVPESYRGNESSFWCKCGEPSSSFGLCKKCLKNKEKYERAETVALNQLERAIIGTKRKRFRAKDSVYYTEEDVETLKAIRGGKPAEDEEVVY